MNTSSARITASLPLPVSTMFSNSARARGGWLRVVLAAVCLLVSLGTSSLRAQTPSVTFAFANVPASVRVQKTLPAGNLYTPSGVAVDEAGDVFIADSGNNRVVEIPAGCATSACQVTIASDLKNPEDVAVDGAGNLYIVENAFPGDDVLEIPAGCTLSSCQITVANNLNDPEAVALDIRGDVFIADTNNNRVVEVPAGCKNSACQTAVGNGLSYPTGVAVDGAGDVFIADQGNSRLVEVSAGCASASCQLTLASGFDAPTGVAVDFAGDVFVTTSGTTAIEIPAGCTSSGCQMQLGSGLNSPQNLTVDQRGDLFIADTFNNRIVEEEILSVDFGAVAVGSNSSLTVAFNINANVTLGTTPSVVTQGAAGLDFESGGTSTCTGEQTAGSTCAVRVRFAPLAPGLRKGAVQLFDSSGNLQATVFIQGTGSGPELAFTPGTQTTVAGEVTYPFAVAVDAAGDLFAGYASNHVAKIPAGCTSATCLIPLGSGLAGPQGVAVDGAGDVFIADYANAQVVEVPASCVPTNSCQNIVVSGLQTPEGVAVDGAGNLFIADTEGNEILEVPSGCTSSTCQIVVLSGSINPVGVTLDNAGDLLFSEISPNQVLELPRVPAGFGPSVTVATGLGNPDGLAVDGAGDVFVADSDSTSALEIPADGSAQTALGSGLNNPRGLAADGAGDVFIAGQSGVSLVELERSQTAPLSFGTVQINSSSAAQTVTVQNVGNQPLTFTGFTVDKNFQLDSSTTTCSTSSSLAQGATCTIGVVCSPTTISSGLSGNLSIFDNTLNQTQGKQQVSLSCASSAEDQTITFTLPASEQALTSLALTGTASSGLPVAYASSTPSVCSVSGSTAQFLTSGTCTINASQKGNSDYNAATPVSASTTVTVASQSITFSLPASEQALTSLALTGTASSGLQVTYASSTPAVCSVSGSTAQFLTSGTCTIAASQAGNSVYAAATPVSASTTVTTGTQTITFTLPASEQALTSLALTGTASSGLQVTYASSTPSVCSVSGSTAQFLTSGTCTISASQAGNSVYAAATPVSASTKVTQVPQTITFNPLSGPVAQGSAVTLSATATSGLAVSFSSLTPAVCSVSGSTATLLNAGTCTIQASQPGNAVYAAATPVSESVTATAAFTITPTPKVETIRRGNIAAFILELQAASGFSGKVTLSCSGGPSGSYCADFPMTVSFQKGVALAVSGIYFPSSTPPGTYTLTFTGTSGAISSTTTAEFIVTE